MDSGTNIDKYVNEKTVKFGIGELGNIGSYTLQKQLIQIELYFQEICANQEKLSEQIKKYRKLSISSISVGSKVPRSQINLNTNTLKYYIEKRILEIEKKDILEINKHAKLKSEKVLLETYMEGIRQQVVDSCEIILRLEMLEEQNKRLIVQMESRQRDVLKLEEENSQLRKVLSKEKKISIIGKE